MKKSKLIFLILFFMIFVGAGAARAQGNIHLGKLEIHPGVNLGYTYSDNINQESDAAKADPAIDKNPKESIIEVTPGVELRFPTTNHMFRLGYNLSIFDFLNRGETDFKNSAMGSLEFNFPVGLILRLSDNFAQRVFPAAQPELQEQSGIVKHWENNAFAEIGYTLTQRWSVSGRYKNQMLRFENLSSYDRDVNSGGVALFMRMMAKVSLFGEAWVGKVGYKESASNGQDATFVQGFLGLGGRISPKTNFTLRAGFEHRGYKDSAYPTTNQPVASLVLEEKPNTHFSCSVYGSRSVNETVYENNSSYISTGGGANVTFLTLRMLAVGADVSYFLLQYEKANLQGDKRTDKILEISPNFKVDITRWLRAQVGYTLSNRSSNVTDYEYKENRIRASLNAVL
ncbi:MAG: outer membrane beta-barrel protein [bacterium]|nr:outer membrane beta-barrel protein [bacterium]